MTEPAPPTEETAALPNLPVFSVSEITAAIKRTM